MDPLAGSPWSTPDTVAGFVRSPPNEVLLGVAAKELGLVEGRRFPRGAYLDAVYVEKERRIACRFRLRRKAGPRWERYAFTAEPRSAYVLRGPARTEWEHSIPAIEGLRYSITFRQRAGGK